MASWLDRFRNDRPAEGKPIGRSGRRHYRGFIELEELNIDLRHPTGTRIFDEMWRGHGDVRRALSMVCNPLMASTYTVDPYGGDEADQKALDHADFIRWLLFEYMRPRLPGHLREAVPIFTRLGFAPFEEIWKGAEHQKHGKVLVPYKLALRHPRTITEWYQNDFDELETVVQYLPTGEHGGRVEIPAKDIVYYRCGAEGDNWEGTSLLRAAYRHWLIIDGVERVDAIAQEREATGIPILYPPTNKSQDPVIDDIADALAKLKAGEEAYIIMPGPHAQDLGDDAATQGWRLEILGMSGGASGGTRDPSNTLKHHSDKIAAAVVAEFMRLGQAGEGARATADVQQDPFYAGVDALASCITDPWNDELIPRIIALNFDDADGAPTLKLEKVDATSLTDLQTYTTGLVGSGALTPDEPLEDWLRERAKMPAADPAERQRQKALREEKQQLEVEGLKTPPPDGPKPGDKGQEKITETNDPHPTDGRRRVKTKTKETLRKFSLELGVCPECGCEAAVEGVCPECGHEGDVEAFGWDPKQPRDEGGRWAEIPGAPGYHLGPSSEAPNAVTVRSPGGPVGGYWQGPDGPQAASDWARRRHVEMSWSKKSVAEKFAQLGRQVPAWDGRKLKTDHSTFEIRDSGMQGYPFEVWEDGNPRVAAPTSGFDTEQSAKDWALTWGVENGRWGYPAGHSLHGREREYFDRHWRQQPRDPGGEGGGQWVDGPGVGDMEDALRGMAGQMRHRTGSPSGGGGGKTPSVSLRRPTPQEHDGGGNTWAVTRDGKTIGFVSESTIDKPGWHAYRHGGRVRVAEHHIGGPFRTRGEAVTAVENAPAPTPSGAPAPGTTVRPTSLYGRGGPASRRGVVERYEGAWAIVRWSNGETVQIPHSHITAAG